LLSAKGDLFFWCWFCTSKDWLYKTIPYFKDPKWGCSNPLGTSKPHYSVLTKIQAFALDAHFTLEQVGRNSKLHFNGTAGNVFWMRELGKYTEDLDLSYRAQLKLGIQISWKCGYLLNYQPLSVLRDPNRLDGIKEELKTSVKCRSRTPIKVYWIENKAHGMFHLLIAHVFWRFSRWQSTSCYIKMSLPYSKSIWLANLFVITSILFFISYWATFKSIHGGFKNFLTYITLFITFYTIAMGFHFIIP
jgi:hypothetical protein